MRKEETINDRAEHAPFTGATVHRTDWTEWESVSSAIVLSVSAVTGVEPIELPVLADAIDPDALDSLLRSDDNYVAVSFAYAGCTVTVYGDGELVIELQSP